MARKWTDKGADAPLFDKLRDENPQIKEEHPIFKKYDRKELLVSVQKEVSNILNTRCKMPYQEYKDLDPADLEYGFPELFGLPDQSYADPKTPEGADKMADLIANAIEIFEPRLANVSIEIQEFHKQDQSLSVGVSGDLVIGDVREPISFPVAVQDYRTVATEEKVGYDTTAKIEYTKGDSEGADE